MNRRLSFLDMLIVLAAATLQAQPEKTPSASDTVRHPVAPTAQFAAPTDGTFDQAMDDAMSVMHSGILDAPQTGDPDRDFVTVMIPHHQGAIDMAKALSLYGKDEQLKRLAQEIIADQQNEVQLMRLWLAEHPDSAERANASE